jgi:hypothetical protein
MLFKVLKLFGLDIPATAAAAKSAIEQRAEEVADYAKQTTQTAALIVALCAVAGISGALALGVGLLALYRVVAESMGSTPDWVSSEGACCRRFDFAPPRPGKGADLVQPSYI